MAHQGRQRTSQSPSLALRRTDRRTPCPLTSGKLRIHSQGKAYWDHLPPDVEENLARGTLDQIHRQEGC